MVISSSKKLTKPITVGILGGSIEGLTLGLLLRDLGCDVHIFDRNKKISLDAAKGIWADAKVTKYLTDYTNMPLEGFCAKTNYLRYFDDRGYIISEEKQIQHFTSHKILHEHLYTLFGSANYHLGYEISGLMHENDSITLSFSNGKKSTFNLLVCTEGPDSFIRSLLMPEATLNYAGYSGWHGSVNQADLSEETFQKLRESLSYQLLPNSHIVTHPVINKNGATSINYTWYQNVVEGSFLDDLLTGVDGKKHRHRISGKYIQEKHLIELSNTAEKRLSPVMAELIFATKKRSLEVIYDLQVQQMAFENILLMGNSAFHTRPHIGMEVSKAVTDAWELAKSLSENNGNLKSALIKWEAKQLEFGKRIVTKSARMGNRSQFENSWQPGDNSLNLGLSAANV